MTASVLSTWHSGVLDPPGPVAAAERTIALIATEIMLAVIVPLIVGTVAFKWWFRSSKARALRRKATNNILAHAFGVFVIGLIVFGSIIVMAKLDSDMMPTMPSTQTPR